jgi:hypothetical protein
VEEEVEEELIDADTSVTTTMRRNRQTGVTLGPRWKSLEYECLIDAWKQVRFCPITGANQSSGRYYKKILDSFNVNKNYGEYATMHMIRNEGADQTP